MKIIPTITIGIPVYLPRPILLETLKSIQNQSYFKYVSEILIVVDGENATNRVLKKLKYKKTSVVFFPRRQGQTKRINDLFKRSTTRILVLTNDDVIWHKDALKQIVKVYQSKEADLISTSVIPLKSRTLFENIVVIGHLVNAAVSSSWNDGDNYLSCNGRLIALSRKLYKKLKIPSHVWNNDAYMYIYAKLHAFKYTVARKAVAYYRSPSKFKEHFNQSRKFQYSFQENQRTFKKNLLSLYRIPRILLLKSLVKMLKKKPLLTSMYIGMTVCIRIAPQNTAVYKKKPYWEIDSSTKQLFIL